jgi:hypothetical protein
MRRTLGFLLPVVVTGLVGCFSSGERAARTLDAGPPTGDRDRTLEYWGKLRDILRTETRSNDLREVGAVVRHQAEAIRNLSPENVDVELVAAADALVRSQEQVLEAGELAGFNPVAIRGAPEVLRMYTEAGKRSAAATARLKNLGPTLAARYGVAFPALDLGR